MRIALLTETYPPDVGGLAISAARLAHLLVGAGHTVEVFAPWSGLAPGAATRVALNGVVVHRLGAYKRTDDTLGEWFRYVIARHAVVPFDLLHAYFLPQAGFVAAYAGNYVGLPAVVSARGNDLDRAIFDPGKAAHVIYALQHASAVTANTSDLVRKAQALGGRAATLIPNGVDTALFAPSGLAIGVTENTENMSKNTDGADGITQRSEAIEPISKSALLNSVFSAPFVADLPVLGFVGEARAKKGLAPLLVAFRAVARERLCALLLIGGVRAGNDQDLLTIFVKQNPDLPLAVVPYAPQHTLPSLYNLLDLLLMPALYDGLPNALLEGMACARAIIATPVGGIADALRNDDNGVFVAPGDANALAAAIRALLDDPLRRDRLGAAARATVLRDYTPERELAGNLAVYGAVTADRTRDHS